MKGTEKRKSQIPEQLDKLSSEVGELEKIVDMLRDRLQPVLRNESGVVEIVGSMVNLLEL